MIIIYYMYTNQFVVVAQKLATICVMCILCVHEKNLKSHSRTTML